MMVKVILEPPQRRPGARTVLDALRWVFLLVAIVSLGYYVYVLTDTKVYQAYEDFSFQQQSRGLTPSWTGFVKSEIGSLFSSAGPETEEPVSPEQEKQAQTEAQRSHVRPRYLAKDALIGRIEIPRLHVHAIVEEGVDDKTLRRAVGHVPGTALPGDDGNVALAAHRDTFFRGLKDVEKDDHIQLRTLQGDYDYVVESTRIVSPKDVGVLKPTKDPVLTLVTCYPFYYVGNAPKRFIVQARQVPADARVTSPRAVAAP